MNILFVCHDFLQTPKSAIAGHVKKLAFKVMAKTDFEVDILCLAPSSSSLKPDQVRYKTGLKTIEIKNQPRLFTFEAVRSRNVFCRVDDLLNQRSYDIMHVFTLGALTAAPMEIARGHGLNIFMSLCDFWFICEENIDLTAENPLCAGPENKEKCVECFLKNYIQDAKRDELKLPLKDHKKARFNYLDTIWNSINRVYAHSRLIENKYNEYGRHKIELVKNWEDNNIDELADKFTADYTRNNVYKKKSLPEKSKRILFYCFDKMHIPILAPIYKQMKNDFSGYRFAFAAMPRNWFHNAGFREDELDLLKVFQEKVTFYPQEFVPDVTIVPDSYYPDNCGRIVHVGHGVLSKGIYYCDSQKAREEEKADLVCVPGVYHQTVLGKLISTSVLATGMAKLDSVFKGDVNKKSVCRSYNLPVDNTYILYAPTYNPELSSLEYLLEGIDQVLLNEKSILLIKLHSRTIARYKSIAQKLVQKHRRIIYIAGQDITPFLSLADIMISDVSSAMMEFAALDKPVVLFNNPAWKDYEHFNPGDIDFAWRDMAVQIDSAGDLKSAVIKCLDNPGRLSEVRKKYTDQLFANKYNGDASGNIARLVSGLAES